MIELEQENTTLKVDLDNSPRSGGDVERRSVVMLDFPGEIMNLLGKMVSRQPEEPQMHQSEGVFDDSAPFVVVLIDGCE